ncbi:MAG TPA: ATP-dependent DNA helicase [Bacillaceae bacterium]|nr:ATP-dependent DNA helicase [Bacillaceae bacterium]
MSVKAVGRWWGAVDELRAKLERYAEALFAEGGILSQVLPGYRPRHVQRELYRVLVESFLTGRPLLAEATTGTGKTLAYLLAASLYAVLAEDTVVVATHTLPLQEQIVNREWPVAREALRQLGLPVPRLEIARGRGNYVCLRRLFAWAEPILTGHARSSEVSYVPLAVELVGQALELEEGLRDEFPQKIPGEVWEEIRADPDDCLHHASPYYSRCYVQRARRRLAEAEVVVTNHALYLTDVARNRAGESGVLPPHGRVLFDEAHRLADVFPAFFGREITLGRAYALYDEVRRRRRAWVNHAFPNEGERAHLLYLLENFLVGFRKTFEEIVRRAFSAAAVEGNGLLPSFGDGEGMERAGRLAPPFDVSRHERAAYEVLRNFLTRKREEFDASDPGAVGIRGFLRRLDALEQDLSFFLAGEGGDAWVYGWSFSGLEVRRGEATKGDPLFPASSGAEVQSLTASPSPENVVFFARPLDAGEVLGDHWEKVAPVFLSATLAVAGEVDLFAREMGLRTYTKFLAEPPPGTFGRILYVGMREGPFPPAGTRAPDHHTPFVTEKLKELYPYLGGKVLVLFTNFRAIEEVAASLSPWAEAEGVEVLAHTPASSREELLERFRQAPRALLLGNDTFWEGIDLRGDSLRAVVITKIPFPNPRDPLVAALAARHSGGVGDEFRAYMLPKAIVKLRQGLGRLIRHETDRGVVVFLDPRLFRRSYGRLILSSLPHGPWGEIGDIPIFFAEASREGEGKTGDAASSPL